MKKETFDSLSKKKSLKITLNSLGVNTSMLVNTSELFKIDYIKTLVLSPNTLHRYSCRKNRISSKQTDGFLRELFKECNFCYVNYFKTFNSKNENSKKTNILKEVKENSKFDKILIIKNDQGVVRSLFNGIRNAVAHGNLLYNGSRYFIFSIENNRKIKKEEDKKITFLLICKDLYEINEIIDKYENLINKYKNNP